MGIKQDLFGGREQAKGINSKRKGNENELALSKWLSKWTGLEFKRTPSSGGLGWSNSVQTVGDVVCITPDVVFPFTIETKFLNFIGINKSGKLRKNSAVFTIWEQCLREGEAANKIPLLFVRTNGMKKGTWNVFYDWYLLRLIDINPTYWGYNEKFKLRGNNTEILGTLDYNDLIIKLK